MNLIGSGLGSQVHIGAGGRPELSRGDVGLNLEFLDGVDRRLNRMKFEEVFVVIHAVQGVVVGVAAIARYRHIVAPDDEEAAWIIPLSSTWNQEGQLGEVSSIERQLNHLSVIND